MGFGLIELIRLIKLIGDEIPAVYFPYQPYHLYQLYQPVTWGSSGLLSGLKLKGIKLKSNFN